MNNIEKIIVLGALITTTLYIVLFNLNFPHYWSNSPRVVPEKIIDALWLIAFILSFITVILCIVDTGKRGLSNRAGWIAYIILFGVVGVPHYYIKYGRHPHAVCT